jgi:hypothetical protein
MALRVSEGGVTFSVDSGVEDLVRRAIEQASPGVVAAVEKEVRLVAEDARDQWPVKTGRSKAGLTLTTIVSTDDVRARIYDDVPYVFYIRPTDLGGKKTAWNTYVQIPMRTAAKHLAEDILGPAIVAAIRGA